MDIGMRTTLCLMTIGALLAPALGARGQSMPAAPYAAQSASALTLPAPPYAAAEQTGAARYGVQRPETYGGPQDFDRYGGGGSHPRLQARADVHAPAYTGPRLAWNNKTETAPVQRPAAYAYAPRPYQAPVPVARSQGLAQVNASAAQMPAAPQGQSASPPPGWSFVEPIGQRPAEPKPLPTSIYAPPPPAAPQAEAQPQAAAVNDPTGARHYSVHRDYGIEPDPIPLPPQFFGNTADMSKPETDEPVRRTVNSTGKTQNALQPSDGQ